MLVIWYFILGLVGLQFNIYALSITSTTSTRYKRQVQQSAAFKKAEQAMLKSMGLKKRPRTRRGFKVPQYMIDLYNSDREHPDWTSTRFRFADKWTSVNTVRAFHHQDDLLQHQADTKSIIKFDLSTFPMHEAVHSAELRLYKTDAWKKANDTHVRIKIYRLTQPRWNSQLTSTLIDSKIVNVTSDGWETFNVQSAVDHWLRNPLTNLGIEVHITTRDGNTVNISANNIVNKPEHLSDEQFHEERPLLVAYAHDPHNHHHVRRKRSSHSARKRKRPQYCRRHALAVDFSDVGWNDWIVAPRGYDSFYCAGECPYPITKHLNGTNHAIVQTIMKGVNPDVPNVCCIPTELSPINMLYMDASDKVVLKKYKEMVVEGCGCR